jgi:hypothetical protein
MHHAAVTVIVVYGVVLRAAVPEGQRPDLPPESAGELGLYLMLEQEVQQRRALRLDLRQQLPHLSPDALEPRSHPR